MVVVAREVTRFARCFAPSAESPKPTLTPSTSSLSFPHLWVESHQDGGDTPYTLDVYTTRGYQGDTLLPADHAIYGTGDAKLKSVTYRLFFNGQREPNTGPRLRGITTGGRLRVVYSQEDLTAGWAGLLHDGIQGYTVDSARTVGRAVLMYVAGR